MLLGERAWLQYLRRTPLHWILALGDGGGHADTLLLCVAESRLLQLEFVEAKAAAHLSHELLEDYQRALHAVQSSATAPPPPPSQQQQQQQQQRCGAVRTSLCSQLEDFRDAIAKTAHVLGGEFPGLVVRQAALNERDSSAASKAAVAAQQASSGGAADRTAAAEAARRHVLIKWHNKPQEKAACIRTFTGIGDLCWAVDVSHDGRHIAIGGSDCCVHVMDLASGSELSTLIYHTDDISFVVWVDTVRLIQTVFLGDRSQSEHLTGHALSAVGHSHIICRSRSCGCVEHEHARKAC
eukprot:COSAG01_NODE_2295_length_7967_cov_3.577021_9_plen_296_part_00